MMLRGFCIALVLQICVSITPCQLKGPEYWCESCKNAKECAPEIEELLEFCQVHMNMLSECIIPEGLPANYVGYAEGVTQSPQSSNGYYFGSPTEYYQNDGASGANRESRYYGNEQFLGDTVGYYEYDDGYYVSSLPMGLSAFEEKLLKEFELNTAFQWGYAGEAVVTTLPPVGPTDDDLQPTNSQVTQSIRNPGITPPVITRPLFNITAFAGQATVLSCTAESDTEMGISIVKLEREPKKSWLENDKRSRMRSDKGDRKSITAFLTIAHLDEVDSGWYVCMSINGGGRDRSLMYLSITDLCKGVECEGYQACIPDYSTTFTSCQCPECENGLELVCGSNCKTYQNDCWLAKDNCDTGTNHSMMIHAPCPRVVPPMFTVEPSDTEVEEGHHLILECHALAFPVPQYSWYRLEDGEHVHVGEGTQYRVDEAAYKDTGYYYCIASICEQGYMLKSRVARVQMNEHNLSTRTKTITERVCRVFGDPHITSFDGNNFNFPGQCSYILNMDCELATWSVYGKFENCSGIGMQGSCLQSITVVYENSAIELQRGWSINYQGSKIDFFETQQHEVPFFHFDLDENLNLHVMMENGASIIWDGLYSVQIKLSPEDDTKYCGICGDGDGDKTNDFVSSHVYFYNDDNAQKLGILDFGDSWKIDAYNQCPEWRGLTGPRGRCSHDDRAAARVKCREMFSHPAVLTCEDVPMIDTEYYIDSCTEDSCIMSRWDNFDPACGVLSAYTSACRASDVYIDDSNWRVDVGCSNLKEHQRFVISTGCPKTTLVKLNRN